MTVRVTQPSEPLLYRLWSAFTLKDVERRVASHSVQQSDRIREWYDEAHRREEAALQLLDSGDISVGVELSISAALLYVRAALASELPASEAATLSLEGALAALDELLARRGSTAPASFSGARAILIAPASSRTSLVIEEALTQAAALPPALAWLRSLSEPRSLAQVKEQRLRRITLLGLAALSLVAAGIHRLTAPPNLALHRPVVVSSTHPNSNAPLGGVVDGIIDQGYGVHTAPESSPWVMVDLERIAKVRRVAIYNRGDGWFDDCLPLSLEISVDGKNFEEVAKRTTGFGQFNPWVFKSAGKPARYVRVRGKPNGYLALSEVEVYGG